MAEIYYKKVTRIIEMYVIFCFVLITFVPLLNFSWVFPFTKFIYYTGFPLLILLILASLVKDSIIKIIERFIGEEDTATRLNKRK